MRKDSYLLGLPSGLLDFIKDCEREVDKRGYNISTPHDIIVRGTVNGKDVEVRVKFRRVPRGFRKLLRAKWYYKVYVNGRPFAWVLLRKTLAEDWDPLGLRAVTYQSPFSWRWIAEEEEW